MPMGMRVLPSTETLPSPRCITFILFTDTVHNYIFLFVVNVLHNTFLGKVFIRDVYLLRSVFTVFFEVFS